VIIEMNVNDLRREANLLFEALQKESDRGDVLVSAAFFDTTLERLLRARFSSSDAKRAKLIEPLFDAFGPLSTFSAKIRISYAIDLLNESMANDLDLVRRIRNAFAHSLEPKTFQDPDITSMVDNLVGFAATKIDINFAKLPPYRVSRIQV
jgi:DNA-binding MltR family transcriptional regulator